MLLNRSALAYAFETSQIDPASGILNYRDVKDLLDRIAAFLLLVVASPLMLLCAVLVGITSSGPIIFRQIRLTKDGKEFSILKFRTMIQDAEATSGAVWAKANDPRITSVGRILRQTRLDELPQLFNVLKGEMSLIGPRPERPEIAQQLSAYFPRFDERLQVRAGISGLAQIGSGYASCMRSYKKKLALDLIYVKNRCLFLDLRIAVRTVIVMLTGAGAR